MRLAGYSVVELEAHFAVVLEWLFTLDVHEFRLISPPYSNCASIKEVPGSNLGRLLD